ncbi:hypothetical protein N7537_010951 [Penicillium hordei]|uniref:Uncharacterized protein n=1 Tax=Penicillium hordei TaxID=40994 RepID=A0AAD6DKU3_9EURO|nr:uncharacterized protein N7537_010951 [Penicillium hordei]KAJ5588273.1 hypothetical protein N7537_010951 [Penicillium hordei]
MASLGYNDSTACLIMGQIVEHRPLRLASDTKEPAQAYQLRNLMAHRSMAPVWDKSMHGQIDV